jgi:hypothetical protein
MLFFPVLTTKCVIVLGQICCIRDKRGIMMRKAEVEVEIPVR